MSYVWVQINLTRSTVRFFITVTFFWISKSMMGPVYEKSVRSMLFLVKKLVRCFKLEIWKFLFFDFWGSLMFFFKIEVKISRWHFQWRFLFIIIISVFWNVWDWSYWNFCGIYFPFLCISMWPPFSSTHMVVLLKTPSNHDRRTNNPMAIHRQRITKRAKK